MNLERKKALKEAIEAIETGLSALHTIAEDEQEAFDAIPETQQESERAEKIQEWANNLNEAHEEIENICDNLKSMME